MFQPGATTETLQRFSSVAGEQGSPDTWRDVRGFSVKFYTTEGNYDIVGNNTPVFFIRDGIKFPDFIHSQKRLPGSGLRDADMQWDFWTLSPESAHQVTYLMGDRGLPRSWRDMPGFGSHTYQWINAAGERFWVKYHFTSNQGNVEIDGAEAELIAGADADYYRRDLYEAIEAGNFPSWDVHVQVMPYEEGKTYRFNPFDLTKVWPHADYPLIKVGTHTLNRNPENFFAEIEQAAFSPANLVPGIDTSPDKMLMARIFSYPDAQRYRVGANYNQIPVNAPMRPGAQLLAGWRRPPRLQRRRAPRSTRRTRSAAPPPTPAAAGAGSWENDGELAARRSDAALGGRDFGQAGTLYREVFDDAAKASLPRDHHRCRQRRHPSRGPRARHPVLDERRRRARRSAARDRRRGPRALSTTRVTRAVTHRGIRPTSRSDAPPPPPPPRTLARASGAATKEQRRTRSPERMRQTVAPPSVSDCVRPFGGGLVPRLLPQASVRMRARPEILVARRIPRPYPRSVDRITGRAHTPAGHGCRGRAGTQQRPTPGGAGRCVKPVVRTPRR